MLARSTGTKLSTPGSIRADESLEISLKLPLTDLCKSFDHLNKELNLLDYHLIPVYTVPNVLLYLIKFRNLFRFTSFSD